MKETLTYPQHHVKSVTSATSSQVPETIKNVMSVLKVKRPLGLEPTLRRNVFVSAFLSEKNFLKNCRPEPGLEVIRPFSCSTQLSLLLINLYQNSPNILILKG